MTFRPFALPNFTSLMISSAALPRLPQMFFDDRVLSRDFHDRPLHPALDRQLHIISTGPGEAGHFGVFDFFGHGRDGVEILLGGGDHPPLDALDARILQGMGNLQFFFFPKDHARRLFPIPQSHIVDGDLRGDFPAGPYLRLEDVGAYRPFPLNFPGSLTLSLAHLFSPLIEFRSNATATLSPDWVLTCSAPPPYEKCLECPKCLKCTKMPNAAEPEPKRHIGVWMNSPEIPPTPPL